jgi:hypothetical protein
LSLGTSSTARSFCSRGQVEEGAVDLEHPLLELEGHAVTGQQQEARVAAGVVELPGDGAALAGVAVTERGQVHGVDGKGRVHGTSLNMLLNTGVAGA